MSEAKTVITTHHPLFEVVYVLSPVTSLYGSLSICISHPPSHHVWGRERQEWHYVKAKSTFNKYLISTAIGSSPRMPRGRLWL